MKNKVSKSGRYVTIVTVGLFVVLAMLRITGIIVLSWWWVTAPVWAPVALALILMIVFFGAIGYYAKQVK